MLKIVHQVFRFLTFVRMQNQPAKIEHIHLHTGLLLTSGIPVSETLHKMKSDSDTTKFKEMVLCSCSPNYCHLQFVRVSCSVFSYPARC